MTQRITPFLWFEGQAEEAARFYVSVFPDSRIVKILRNGEGGPAPAGTVLTVEFELGGTPFVALNGNPEFRFTPAVSFAVSCATQDEIDTLWGRLTSAGGEEWDCGWLRDKYGVSWQIVPRDLGDLLSDPDPARAQRAMQAMLRMKKLDIAALRAAHSGA